MREIFQLLVRETLVIIPVIQCSIRISQRSAPSFHKTVLLPSQKLPEATIVPVAYFQLSGEKSFAESENNQ